MHAWRPRIKGSVKNVVLDVPENSRLADSMTNSFRLLARADQRVVVANIEAVKRAKKAIYCWTSSPDGYVFLAFAPRRRLAPIPEDDGTCGYGHRQQSAIRRRRARRHACSASTPKPAWFTDSQLKRMANRAIAALPKDVRALQMHVKASSARGRRSTAVAARRARPPHETQGGQPRPRAIFDACCRHGRNPQAHRRGPRGPEARGRLSAWLRAYDFISIDYSSKRPAGARPARSSPRRAGSGSTSRR